MDRITLRSSLIKLVLLTLAFGGSASADQTAPKISKQTRMELMRVMNAEFAFARASFPRGEKGLVLRANGKLSPGPDELRSLLASYGPAARPGERVQITDIEIKDNAIIFEINGGPKKKAKWYQRIEVGGKGGSTPVAAGPDANAKGSSLKLEFEKYVPEIAPAQIKEMLRPVLDFTVKSAAQAYTESLPENVRNAIRDKKVLVGMNREMVTYSKGRPPKRIREKDENNADYEEWVYGEPPDDVEFVRFVGDEVVQLKIMKVDGEKIVRTEKEVKWDPLGLAASESARATEGAATPATGRKAPTLRRAGEETLPAPDGSVKVPVTPVPSKKDDSDPPQ